jgi:hypothetical protein
VLVPARSIVHDVFCVTVLAGAGELQVNTVNSPTMIATLPRYRECVIIWLSPVFAVEPQLRLVLEIETAVPKAVIVTDRIPLRKD